MIRMQNLGDEEKILRVAKDKGRVARKDLNVAAEISTAQDSNSELLSTK